MGDISWSEESINTRKYFQDKIISYTCLIRLKPIFDFFKNEAHSVLEIAAGDGHYTNHLAKSFSLQVADISEKMLKNNPLKENAVITGLPHTSFKDKSYDIVFVSNVLHHLEDENAAIIECKRIAKKYLVIIEPNRLNPFNFLVGLLIKNERKSLLYSKKYLDKKFYNSNLKILYYNRFGFLPPNNTPNMIFNLFKWLENRVFCFGLDHVYILSV